MLRFLSRLALVLWLPTAAAAELKFISSVQQTTMVELYTSEGCSSCPPAEKRLNGYAGHSELWTRLVPLAFHVDYWDYLGWRDRFAKPEHSDRQRRYAALKRVSGVYTPAFIVNGTGWRPGRLSDSLDTETVEVGRLSVTLDGKRLRARFTPNTQSPGTLDLHLAVLGMGLRTVIRAGENAGRTAHHDFVVLSHTEGRSKNGAWELTLPETEQRKATGLALAAWVSQPGDPAPLQATGGYLNPPPL
jgi:hypothetical protein